MWRLRKLRSGTGAATADRTIQPGVPAEEPRTSIASTRIEISENSDQAPAVIDALIKFNVDQVGPNDYRTLNVFVRDGSGQIVGGLVGSTYWGWLNVVYFWMHPSWRCKGLGTTALRTAEEEAIRRGCFSAQVATFSFQSPEFYKANGYECYATLDDFPFGHRQYFFRKRLGSQAAHRT